MWKDHATAVHRGQEADRRGLHPGFWGRAWHQGERRARAQGGLHASGENCTVENWPFSHGQHVETLLNSWKVVNMLRHVGEG